MENAAGPTIFKAPDIAPGIPKSTKSWFKSNLVKIIIAVLVIGVLIEGFYGAVALFSPSKARNLNILGPSVNEITPARLSLIPQKSSYKKGDTVVVDVKLYTGGYNTSSTDLAIKYDPAFLKPQGQNFVAVGQIYPEYPPVQIEEKKGLIGISGIPLETNQGFSGVGLFAKLNFTALKEGQTDLTIDYQPNSTSDSNVVLVSSSKDILGVVDNAHITISETAASDNQTALGQTCASFTQYCQTSSGNNGTQVCSSGIINNGSCSYDPRVTISCTECKI